MSLDAPVIMSSTLSLSLSLDYSLILVMSHVPWMAMEIPNVDTMQQNDGETQEDGIWTGRDPSSDWLTSIVNEEQTNVALEIQFSHYQHQDVAELSSFIQDAIPSYMHYVSIVECETALEQMFLPSQSTSWAIFTIISPECAKIELRDQVVFCRIEHGWEKVHTKLDYIQIRDLRFGACTERIVEEAYRLLQRGGRLHHITIEFERQENSSCDPTKWDWGQLRPVLDYSVPVEVGFQFIETQSYPLDLRQLHTEGLVARSQDGELLSEGRLLASCISDACEKKELAVNVVRSIYIKLEATAI